MTHPDDSPRSMLIRPMRPGDVPALERLSSQSYHELDERTFARGWPDPAPRSPERGEAWQRRCAHLLGTDPGGCWVAEVEGEPIGFATSYTRELMWILASFAVRPGMQRRGVGVQLLAAALHHGRGCLRGMLSASADPAAVRRYRLSGFSLHPQMFVTGVVDRALLPVVEHVREGTASDLDLCDSLDRRTRGAAHGGDHEILSREFRLLVVDRPAGSGYAYVDTDGSPVLLAATTRRTAADLMWDALASSSAAGVTIAHITAANEWAIDVAVEARLELHQLGYLALRGMKPPAPYLHHGSFL